jgi:hypothetical protein
MTSSFRMFISTAAAIAAAAAPLAAQKPADSTSAHAAAMGFITAFDSLQWEPFRAYLADDMTMFFPFPQMPRRADGAASVAAVFRQFFDAQRAVRSRAGRPMVQGLVAQDFRLQMVGPDVAIASFHLGVVAPARRTVVLHRKGASWKVIHWHASPAPITPAELPALPEVPIDAAERARFVGTYDFAPEPFLARVFEQESRLVIAVAGQAALPLTYHGNNTFSAAGNNRAVFTLTAGRASAVTLHSAGRTIPGRRVERP